MWSIISWLVQVLFSLIGAVATYLPLWASYKGWNMWGLAWQIWAMIGVTIFLVAMLSVIIRLVLLYVTPEAKLRRKKLELEIEELYDKSPGRRPPR
jgi:hypothetical protein